MTPEEYALLERLFHEARELPADARPSKVAEVREEHGAEMAAKLEDLLATISTERMPPPPPDPRGWTLRKGDVILNRFRIVGPLGRGGMGEVYEAEDEEMGRVALKTIRAEVRSAQSLRRFRQEVQLARKVTHPNVCRIHEFFPPGEGSTPATAFLTMELLEGATLSRRISDSGPLPWTEAQSLALQLCQGLQAIHEAGIIHRDFKSPNVMLATHQGAHRGTPRAVVMDLGLARQDDAEKPDKERNAMTLRGAVMGTPNYMAPEQIEGGAVTPATDIYAFGVVLFEMVTGKLPFDASTPMANAVRRAKRLPPVSSIQPGVPAFLDGVIERCLQYEPEQRFQSAEELAKALTGGGVEPQPNARRISWVLLAVLVIPAVLLAVSGVFIWKWLHPVHVPPKEALDWYNKGLESFNDGAYFQAQQQFNAALVDDKDFAVARARLADAWNELDSEGDASKEMARISEAQEREVTPDQRLYIEAVRSILGHDFDLAIRNFRGILDRLPEGEKAAGYVDLGRTYERAARIGEALTAYGEAKKLAPDSPTALLRAAMLEGRQGNKEGAERDFSAADGLYTKLGMLEGNAEVAYQRSYWLTTLGDHDDYKKAAAFAQRSLAAVRATQGMQEENRRLEVRAMCRLSAIDHGMGRDDEAAKEASDAVNLAGDSTDYWRTDALLRQAAADVQLGHYANAEKAIKDALEKAQHNDWPRLKALAQLNLGALRDSRGGPGDRQDVEALNEAIAYYKTYQFPSEALRPMAILARWESREDKYDQALQAGINLLSQAGKVGDPTALAQAEEQIGDSYSELQSYPDALKHYRGAVDEATRADDPENASYQEAHCADVLVHLGRFEEAEAALPKSPTGALAFEPARIRTRILWGQGKFQDAARSTRRLLAANRALDAFAAEDLRVVGAMAAAESGFQDQARKWSRDAIVLAKGDAEEVAEAQLAEALVRVRSNDPKGAKDDLDQALPFFTKHKQYESLWIAYFYFAQASKARGDKAGARDNAIKSLDNLKELEHNWEISDRKAYEKRADVSAALRDLPRLAGI
jgi:serine/threonine protein kinase